MCWFLARAHMYRRIEERSDGPIERPIDDSHARKSTGPYSNSDSTRSNSGGLGVSWLGPATLSWIGEGWRRSCPANSNRAVQRVQGRCAFEAFARAITEKSAPHIQQTEASGKPKAGTSIVWYKPIPQHQYEQDWQISLTHMSVNEVYLR